MPGKVGGEKQGSGLGGQDPGLGSQGLAEVNYELRIKDWEFPPEFSPLPAAYCFRGGGDWRTLGRAGAYDNMSPW